MRRTYSQQELELLPYLERILRVGVHDVILEPKVVIVVKPGDLGKALGKGAVGVKKVERQLKKSVRLVEYSEDITRVAAQLMYPAQITSLQFEEHVLTVTAADTKSRGIIIGRSRSNIEWIQGILSRYVTLEKIDVQ